MQSFQKIVNNKIFPLVICFALVLIIYAPLLKADFLSMDDKAGIIDNPMTQNLKSALESMYTDPIINAFVYKIFGMSKLAFHFRGILFHAFNAYLVYLLTQRLIGSKSAFTAMLLFAVHPGVSEPVSWISGHTYLYSGMYNLLTLILFVKYRQDKKLLYLILSWIVYLFYVIFNRSPWILVTPILVLCLDWFILLKKIRFNWNLLFILPVLFYIIFLFPKQFQERTTAVDTYMAGTVSVNKFVSIGNNIERSFSLLLYPINLSVSYSFYQPTFLNLSLVIISYLVFLILLYYTYKKDKIIFGLLCLLYISILPLFSPFNISVNQAERYYYLAIAFFNIILGYIFVNKIKKKIGKNYKILLFIIILLFGIRTFARSLDWQNDETLWVSAKKNITNNYNVYNEVGNVYFAKGELSDAMQYYQKALKLRPQYPTALHNIGLIYLKSGQIDLAQTYFEQAILTDVNFYDSYYRLGQIAKYRNDTNQAKVYFMKALEIKKDFIDASNELNKLL